VHYTSDNIYIADSGNNRIREVIASTGKISTVAGNGNTGSTGNESPATSAELDSPTAVALDLNYNLYIADYGNGLIREVASSSGYIFNLAGILNGCNNQTGCCPGETDNVGDGCLAVDAYLYYPYGVAVDNNDNIYIADSQHNRIRAVGSAFAEMTGGTLTAATSGMSYSGGTIIQYNTATGTLGTVSFSTGSLTSGSIQMGGTFNGGGSIAVTTNGDNDTYNGVDFTGTFAGLSVWTLVTLANGTHNYTLTGNVTNSEGIVGTLQLTINTGKGFFNGSTSISSSSLQF
jgi:hypothetical protein